MGRWKYLSESVAGTSHLRSGAPCQDSCFVTPSRLGDEEILIVACSDGAGSAERSDIGSRRACDEFIHVASDTLRDIASLDEIDESIVRGWYQRVREAIFVEAVRLETTPRQLACTLLTAVIGETCAVFAQVGDGSIVLNDDDSYVSVFWPQAGEYVNVTNFLTQPEFEQAFEFVRRQKPVEEVALFTDGLQRLALNFAQRTVHQAFFAPMFESLRDAENADELVVPLRGFLDSAAINERTDDDKTLALATRRGGRGRAA